MSDRLLEQRFNIKFCAKLGKSASETADDMLDAWFLHNDNAPAHDALPVRKLLAKKKIMKLDHPPYSPHLAPCNFWLFPKLKTALKGHRFSDVADIQGRATTILQSIPEE
jgi:hypothetical protein